MRNVVRSPLALPKLGTGILMLTGTDHQTTDAVVLPAGARRAADGQVRAAAGSRKVRALVKRGILRVDSDMYSRAVLAENRAADWLGKSPLFKVCGQHVQRQAVRVHANDKCRSVFAG